MQMKEPLTVIPKMNLTDLRNTSPNTFSPPLDQNQEFVKNFEIKSISQLLKIGRKIKLIDLDLTEYLKLICSHLKHNKPKENEKASRNNLEIRSESAIKIIDQRKELKENETDGHKSTDEEVQFYLTKL